MPALTGSPHRLELDKYMAYDDVGQPGLTQGILVYRQKVTKAKHVELKEAEDEGRECRPYWLLLDAPKYVFLLKVSP